MTNVFNNKDLEKVDTFITFCESCKKAIETGIITWEEAQDKINTKLWNIK